MKRKRIVIGIGLLAAAAGLIVGMRHCRRMMNEHRSAGRRRASTACRPADCAPRRGNVGHEEAAALVA
jgi:hypothetical protein